MKVIYVGTLATGPDRDSNWINAFQSLKHQVIPFSTQHTLSRNQIFAKIQRRLNIGPGNRQMQRELLALARAEMPQWMHFRMPVEFDRTTIEQIRGLGVVLTQYFNDDPFSPRAVKWLFRKFKKTLSLYDGNFVYRPRNVQDYKDAGAQYVEHCPPCYNPAVHFRESREVPDPFLCDAAFIGHWENDGRCNYLDALINAGLKIVVKGGLWDRATRGRPLSSLAPVTHAFGAEYRYIYANARAGLCFFSRINRDSLTERVFEIIAVGGLLVCERTDEAMSYFEDQKEAFFFSSAEELIEIVHVLKTNPQLRESVRSAGYERLLRDGNTIIDRAKLVETFVLSKLASSVRNGI